MKKDRLDRLIESALEENIDELNIIKNIEIPDSNHIWEKFKQRLEREAIIIDMEKRENKKNDRFKIAKRASFVAACIILVSFAFSLISNTTHVKAFRFDIIKTFIDIKNDFFTVKRSSIDTNNNVKGEGSVGPKDGENVIIRELTMEEAKKQVPFSILIPQYMPDGYEQTKIQWRQYKSGTHMLKQTYQKGSDGIIVIEQTLNPSHINETTVGEFEGENVKKLNIDNKEIYIIASDGGFNAVNWYQDEFRCEISGIVLEKDLIDIFKSLKFLE